MTTNTRSSHALSFRVRPGAETNAAALLTGYAAPRLEIDEQTRLLRTTVFLKDTLVVRVIELEGDLGTVARHLAQDPNIQRVERELNQHLEEPYDITDPAARRSFFTARLMEPVTRRLAEEVFGSRHWANETNPTRYALRYPVRPGAGESLAAAIRASGDPTPPPGVPNRFLSTSVFRHGDVVVRVMDIDGRLEDVLAVLAGSPAVHHMSAQLAGLLTEDYDLTSPDGLRRFFAENLMTTLTDRVAPAPAIAGEPSEVGA